jgi:hypothetical protein
MAISGAGWYPILDDVPVHKLIQGSPGHPIIDISGAGGHPILDHVPLRKAISGGRYHPIMDISGSGWHPRFQYRVLVPPYKKL